MEEFWIVKKWILEVEHILHYMPILSLAEERVTSMLQNREPPEIVRFSIVHMVLDGDEFVEAKEGEVLYCPHCDNIIKVKGHWRFYADQIAYEASNGKRCGRCKDDEFLAD